MNAITNATSVASVSRGFDAAIDAFDSYLGGVILAQSAEYGVSRPISAMLLLQKIGAAYRSAAFVVDDKGRGFPIGFNSVMLLPRATGKLLAQHMNDLLADVAAQSADSLHKKRALRDAENLAHVEQVKQLKTDLKKASAEVARYTLISAQLARLSAQEPREGDYSDFEEKLTAHSVRIAALEHAHAQAKADGNAAFATTLRQELKAARLAAPQSYDTEHRHWQTLLDLLASDVGRLEGAVALEARLRNALAAQIANEPKKLVAPKLVFFDTPMPTIRKSLGAAQLGSMLICTGDGVVKALARHGDIVSEMCRPRGSSPRNCLVPLTIFGVTTPGALTRDTNALGAECGDLLSLIHIVSDSPYRDMAFAAGPHAAEVLVEFDEAIKARIRTTVVDDFALQSITLGSEAACLLASTAESIRVFRVTTDMHPVMDAYLLRMPQYICGIAGLLYLGRGESGALSVRTMQNAIDVCRWLADEFEHAVVPKREVPPEYADAWRLRQFIQNYIDGCVQREKQCPLTLALSALCAKSGSIGLTKARIRRAVEFMHGAGWVRLRQDGLDYMVDFDPRHFSMAHP